MIINTAIFGMHYVHLPGCKDCHWEPIMRIMHISLAQDCQILPHLPVRKYA